MRTRPTAVPPRTDRRPRGWAPSRPARATSLICLFAAGASLVAQGQKPPVFKSGVELIAVDVHVTSRDGQPVASLGPDQFDVTVDGRARRVVSAEYLSSTPGTVATAPSDELPPEASFSSNEGAVAAVQGRQVILIVDQGSFPRTAGGAATAAAKRLLDRLPPGDRVALAVFPSPGPRVGLTANRAVISAALEKIVGLQESWPIISPGFGMSEALGIARGDSTTLQAVTERECGAYLLSSEQCRRQILDQVPIAMAAMRRRVAMATFGLQRIIEALAGLDGPKTAVLISTGILAGERVGDLDTDAELRALARSAAAARVNLFALQLEGTFLDAFSVERNARGTTAYRDTALLSSGLESLAGSTGGSYMRLPAGTDAPLDRIAREISGAYLLGVEPLPGDRDGKPHRIQVKVKTLNAQVRSRTEFVLPTTPDRSRTDEQRLAEAVTAQRIASDLPIRMSHVTFGDGADRARIVISVAIGRGITAPAPIKFGYVLYDAAGRAAGQSIEQRTLPAVGAGQDAALSFMDAITVRPGDYTLKFAAMDGQGHLGSLAHNIDARVLAGEGVSTSEMLLVDPSRREEAGPLLPIADGRVVGLSLGAYLEVYADQPRPVPTVSVEIADRPNGRALVATKFPSVVKDEGRRWTAEGVVDLSMLPPGDYVASAVVADGERRLTTVTRPFRLDPRAGASAVGVSIAPRAAFVASSTGQFVRRFNRESALSTDALAFFLGRLQAADPKAGTGQAAVATEAIRQGRAGEAMAALKDAGPDQVATTFLRGLALFATGELEPAAAQFRATIRLSNEFMPAVFYLGACYAAGGKDVEAVGAWQTSLITESDARIVYDVLADALLRLKESGQAISVLTEARDRWPDDDLFLPRLAAAQALEQRRDQALATLGPYVDRHPDDLGAIVLALRLIYESHAGGQAIASAAADRELATKLGGLYRSAQGPEQALIDKWVAFINKSKAGR